jgi:hypothetical protein
MKNTTNLRLIFVQMLFALTLGQLAIKAGDLYLYSGGKVFEFLYAYLHLLLCVIILSTSWVGWQLSQSTENSEKINSVFSLQYLILLIDIFLVIAYFMIVRCVELNDDHTIAPPKASKAVFWTMIIFGVYFIWDVLTKGPKLNYIKEGSMYIKVTSIHYNLLLKRIWPTSICLLISYLIYKYLACDGSSNKSSMIYIILILLFLFFRGLKQEVKKTYKLQEVQIPEKLQTDDMVYPLNIQETKLNLKFFVIKVLPSILLLVSILFYFLFL